MRTDKKYKNDELYSLQKNANELPRIKNLGMKEAIHKKIYCVLKKLKRNLGAEE